MLSTYHRSAGFTLVEILVATAVFSVISILGYQALDAVFALERRQSEEYAERMQVQRTWAIMLNDFIHLRARPVRDQRGDVQRAYQAPADQYIVRFTRGGLPPLLSIPGGLQRVAYELDERGELLRWVWPAADQADGAEPDSQILLAGVDSFQVEQLDDSNFFGPLWPPVNRTNLPVSATPKMLRLRLIMSNGFQLERLIPGVEQP
jgi:general secretion pathway protein J